MTRRTTATPILTGMPRTLFSALCALAAVALVTPATGAAAGAAGAADRAGAAQAAPADGMLIVRSANGVLVLNGRGSVLGQLTGKGRLLIDDPDATDGVPVVSGYDRAQRQSKTSVLYIGSDLRFRVLGGAFKIRVVASGVSLSFVGRGTASLVPPGTLDDGAYSIDGGETYRPLGFGATVALVIGATSAVQPSASPSGVTRDGM